jgi:hypothetical protein
VTLLDDIIAAATDSSASTPDLLRKVLIVARRVGAGEVEAWARYELEGYPRNVDPPSYRHVLLHPEGRFAGPENAREIQPLTRELMGLERHWSGQLRQSIEVLADLEQGEGDSSYPWSRPDVDRYRASGEGIVGMELATVYSKVSRSDLVGVLGKVRTRALDLALDLQADYPEAGEQGGPTVTNQPQMQQVVNNFTTTNNITGDGTNIAAGQDIYQRSKVRRGDDDALREGAGQLGLDAEAIEEFLTLVKEERNIEGPRSRGFLARVRDGAVALSGAVASDVAATTLIDLANGYLGV